MTEITMMEALKLAAEDLTPTKSKFTSKELKMRIRAIPGFENANENSLIRYIAFALKNKIIKKTGVDGIYAFYSIYDAPFPEVPLKKIGKRRVKIKHEGKIVIIKELDHDLSVDAVLALLKRYITSHFGNELTLTSRIASLQDRIHTFVDEMRELKNKHSIEKEKLEYEVKWREEKIKAMQSLLNI
jgi:hypothetical protein